MVSPAALVGAGGGRNAPESERMSKRPWKVTVAPGAAGCRSVTLATVPLPPSTHTPRCLLLAKAATLSPTSLPPCTSKTWGLMPLPVSRVIYIGGLGLFFDPGGLPRGLRPPVPSCPTGGPPGFPSILPRFFPLPGPLLPLFSSSDVCGC
ncbi:hypothetical protein Mapa_009020 [Marchantia paleacea]|nr:hypothetical protein Mapa_009020 [Marchantia paleacea]